MTWKLIYISVTVMLLLLYAKLLFIKKKRIEYCRGLFIALVEKYKVAKLETISGYIHVLVYMG